MCRLAAWASRTPTTLESVLGPDGIDRLSHLSTVHSHGWGASWVDPAGVQQIQRSDRAAHTDPDFTRFARETEGLAAIVHLRLGTPGYGSGLTNVHPFTDDGHAFAHSHVSCAFAHNGAIHPAAQIDLLLSPDSHRTPTSQTDSERYFLSVRDEMDVNGGSAAEAMDSVLERMHEVGLTSSSLNSVMLDPTTLRVISCHDPEAPMGSITVWPVADDVVWPSYFPLDYQQGPELCAAVSSGIVRPTPAGSWQVMSNDVVWSIGVTGLTSSWAPISRRGLLGEETALPERRSA